MRAKVSISGPFTGLLSYLKVCACAKYCRTLFPLEIEEYFGRTCEQNQRGHGLLLLYQPLCKTISFWYASDLVRFMSYLLFPLFSLFLLASAFAQNLTCNAAAQPPLVRQEGLAERTGDIVLTCAGGTPGAQITGNLTLFLSVNITNRIGAGNIVTGVVFTADNGSGPQAVNAPGVLTAPST